MAVRRCPWLALVCVFAATLLVGCKVAASERPTQMPANKGPIEARAEPDTPEPLIIEQRLAPRGEEFEVHLQGNPTTGYGWQVTEIDEQKVQAMAEDYLEDKQGDQQVVGAGGAYIFRFKALADGQTRIKIVYRRAWEENIEPLRTYILELTVR
jgi:predicted secreted protein